MLSTNLWIIVAIKGVPKGLDTTEATHINKKGGFSTILSTFVEKTPDVQKAQVTDLGPARRIITRPRGATQYVFRGNMIKVPNDPDKGFNPQGIHGSIDPLLRSRLTPEGRGVVTPLRVRLGGVE